ncbi:long-chain fatty acid--CoA ligase [Mycolicibacterium sp. CH28]|uniref:AMP-dependent synthetase/ligase n=1 Tax=Mycolicibacterium sp. CH28 TaxID=2512237 RepID=UPI001081B796|nr:long-chain fatty acid--CoA ligase [Mycolicibacterium sp. CH28]TGD87546.1 long-chain fatty acid--CoA ligase [Mycolicibacterium sp. CH28]
MSTLCTAFAETAARVPDRVALRSLGGDREITWAEYASEVAALAATLTQLGVRPGDSVALMMANRIEFHFLDTAIMHLGAVPVSIYNTLRPRDIAYILANSGATLVFAESTYVPVLLEVGATDSAVPQIICIDAPTDGATPLADVLADGAGFDLAGAARQVRPTDLATISYTSGTTGAPKGIELSHGAILRSIAAIDDAFGSIDGARMVSFLPMAHVAERMFSHWRGIVGGFTVTPCPHPSEVGPYLLDVRPHYVFSPPRLFEKLRAAIEVRFDAEADNRRRARIADALEAGAAKVRFEQEDIEVPAELLNRFEQLRQEVFVPALTMVGLDQTQVALTGSAPVPPDLVRFFLTLGLPVFEGWGMSEVTAFGVFNRPDDTRAGTVGRPLRGAEVRLADDGEILFRSPWLMSGYRGRPELTAEAIDGEGWLHTGDIGAYVGDRLAIVDRKKELIISSFGKNMSPSNIEFAVKNASPLIGQVCVIGDARPFVTALVVDDESIAATLSGRRHDVVPSADPAVLEAVKQAVTAANAELSRVEQIKRHIVLDSEWLPGGDELSPTMKLKRRQISEKYRAEIEELNSSDTAAATS